MSVNFLLFCFKNKIINLCRLYGIFLVFIILTTNAQGSCISCSDSYNGDEDNELITTQCGHTFHLHCIASRIDTKDLFKEKFIELKNCPACNKLAVPFITEPGITSHKYSAYCETAEMNACRLGDIIKLRNLLDKDKTKVNKKWDKIQNITLLHIAAKYGNEHCLQALLNARAGINSIMSDGTTALHMAVDNNHVGCVNALIKANAHIDTGLNFSWITPMYIAIMKGYADCINLLHNAKLNLKFDIENDNASLLYTASMNGDIKVIKYLIDANTNVNFSLPHKNSIINTPLGIAIYKGHDDCAEALINAGADLNVTIDEETYTHLAIRRDHMNCLKILIKAGININPLVNYSPLQYAVSERKINSVKLLLKGGAISCLNDLHTSIKNKDIECIIALIKAGLDVNACDKNGMTSLHHAAKSRNIQIVDILLKAGARTDILTISPHFFTPLGLAVMATNIECTKTLLEAGANIQTAYADEPYMHIAIRIGDLNMVKTLAEAKAKLNTSFLGKTCLSVAVKNQHIDIIETLIQAGADVNTLLDDGTTCLQIAANDSSYDIAKILLEAGADANIGTKNTPLHIAVDKKNIDLVVIMLEFGADIRKFDYANMTPLHVASKYARIDIIDLLLKAGADINAANELGMTPLHTATIYSTKETINTLLKAGSDINSLNVSGMTPLHLASRQSKINIVNCLLKAGAHANVVASNPAGFTPLHFAAKNGSSTECLKALLKAGADIYDCDECDSPRTIAIKFGHTECAEILRQAEEDSIQISTQLPRI